MSTSWPTLHSHAVMHLSSCSITAKTRESGIWMSTDRTLTSSQLMSSLQSSDKGKWRQATPLLSKTYPLTVT
jgi:hypothetical protein